MINFYKIKEVLQSRGKRNFYIVDKDNNKIAEVSKKSLLENEKKTTFVLRDKTQETSLGIQKGRLLFSTYRVKMNEKVYILKDNKLNSVLYFCVDGTIDGRTIRFEENWKRDIDLKVNGEKLATIKPKTHGLGAAIEMDEFISQYPLLFSLTCLMYFMFKIYQNEVELIETIVDELT